MSSKLLRLLVGVWGIIGTGWLAGTAHGAEELYLDQVKPLLTQKCTACHGALKQEAGLRLDAASLILQGGSSGPVIEPGQSGQSLLMEKVSSSDPGLRMPPEGEGSPLTDPQQDLLRKWIDAGAAAPSEPIPPSPLDHWAYHTPCVSQPAVGSAAGTATSRLDQILESHHREQKLIPAPPAAPHILLRRVYLDLIGLPPTPDELETFQRDPSPQAYARVVDALLASPLYGERWGRHWMDVWRYSDWSGFGQEVRYSQRHIWRWRDWIVESLNVDKGYDAMIMQMLAADELQPLDLAALRATGFLARNWYKFDRNSWMDDVIEHTSRAFLGVTMKCARCHDHKYDPLQQSEYYQLRAIFEPYDVRIDPWPATTGAEDLARVYDAKPQANTWQFQRGDPKQPQTDAPVAPGVPGVLGGQFKVEPIYLPTASFYPSLRPHAVDRARQVLQRELDAARAERDGLRSASDANSQAVRIADRTVAAAEAHLLSFHARVAAERAKYSLETSSDASDTQAPWSELAADAHRYEAQFKCRTAEVTLLKAEGHRDQLAARRAQGDAAVEAELKQAEEQYQMAHDALQACVAPTVINASNLYEPLGTVYGNQSTGRRLALARWIAHHDNPLTARVAVNHMWLRHFGDDLVGSVDDFGLRSARPPLADLLDYLAVELMQHAWSMKHVHRLIVLSDAYRRASTPTAGAGQDPDNQFFARMNIRRAEAETVRDALLYVAGQSDFRLGGPDIPHDQGMTSSRRSLYFQHAYEKQVELLQVFDGADPRECYRRQPSIRPQQALALLNSEFSVRLARQLAKLLTLNALASRDMAMNHAKANNIAENNIAENNSVARDMAVQREFIRDAYVRILCREPRPPEVIECMAFLKEQTQLLTAPDQLHVFSAATLEPPAAEDPAQRARENLVLVLLNHNDFVSIR